jgi:CheY-like chemotaxis protein
MSTATRTILVVDDESHMRRLIQFNLVRLGYRVVSAADGKEALAGLGGTVVDLVILDVVMPGMDGFAVLREIRGHQRYQQLPVVMLTARGQAEIASQAAELGVQAFLTKPFSPTELGKTVAALLPAVKG